MGPESGVRGHDDVSYCPRSDVREDLIELQALGTYPPLGAIQGEK